MTLKNGSNHLNIWIGALLFSICFFYGGSALSSEVPPTPNMPDRWVVEFDALAQKNQVDFLSNRLGAKLNGIRNTVYNVDGKRVQINVLVVPDSENAEKLMAKLKSMKTEEALFQKGTTVYEFVGENDVLPLIAEGRKHLDSI
jgi:hypothetical protein